MIRLRHEEYLLNGGRQVHVVSEVLYRHLPLLHPIQRSDLEQILADDHQSSEVSARRVDPHLIRNGGVVRWDKM